MAVEIIINPFEEDDLSGANTIHRTYKMDFNKKRIGGFIDNFEASQQAIMKAMMTRRFAYEIYDDQYGCDVMNKIGNTSLTKEYLDSDIPFMLEDMLLPEDTVIGIGDVEYTMLDGDSLFIRCLVQTIYGQAEIEGVIANE